jgi:hypothetical protein
MMNKNKWSPYRVWLLIFTIVFLLGLVGIFGLRAYISSSSRMGELKTGFSTIIPAGIILLADIVLAVAAIILSIRTTLKRSTYKVWFLIIAIFFLLQFGWGLIGTISDFKTLQIHETFATNKAQYYNVIGNSIIPLIYGALSIVAIILSRRFSTLNQPSSISK